jgi:ubiquinone/menaquinone biosynthesis C-methylase UbiE
MEDGILLMTNIESYFGHPRGIPGMITGRLMVRMNRERIDWVVSLLNVQPGEAVLEIGFGPGVAIQQIARQSSAGLVAGVDASDIMVRQAGRRNVAAIRENRVELQYGSASDLPYPDRHFDRAFAINSLHHWPDQDQGLAELSRVLKPGGRAMIAEQPRWLMNFPAERVHRYGEQIAARFETAGFKQIEVRYQEMEPVGCLCIMGVK